jgi:hypothetical protein
MPDMWGMGAGISAAGTMLPRHLHLVAISRTLTLHNQGSLICETGTFDSIPWIPGH